MDRLTGKRVRTRPGCEVREITVDDVVTFRRVDGVAVTTALRTVFDCGRWLSVVEGVVVADALAHLGLASQGELAWIRASAPSFAGSDALTRWWTTWTPTASH